MPPLPAPPTVSVLMAVHNGMPYLPQALASLQQQSLRNIEIIVVDDGSQDGSADVVQAALETDARIRLARLDQNVGLAAALNHGLDMATGRYVARMDADDIAHENRLEQQAADLNAHPGIVLLGASIRRINAKGAFLRTEIRDLSAWDTAWTARLHAPLIHPTFMFPRACYTDHGLRYDPELRVAQDYDFTARALKLGDVVSRPEVLLDYRVHEKAASSESAQRQSQTAGSIAARIQADTLPEEVARALAPVNAAFYRGGRDMAAVRTGLRRLMRHDCAQDPAHTAQIKSKTADLFHYLICARLGQNRQQAAMTLARTSPDLAIPLARHKLSLIRRKRQHAL